MFVITSNGKVITGWRAWLIGLAIFAAATLFVCLLAFLMMGVAVTLWAVMLIAIPAAVIVGLAGMLFRKRS